MDMRAANITVYRNQLIYGRSKEEHDHRLNKILRRLREYNVMLNDEKCEFRKPEIMFLGLKISKEGIKPNEEKVEALRISSEPKTKEELLSFLGLL